MTSLFELSRAVYTWASVNGILIDTPPRFDSGNLALVPFLPDTTDFFRQRKITRVGYDEESKTLTIYSRLPIAKAKKERLISQFSARYREFDYSLVLSESRPHKIRTNVQSYGQLVPVHRNGDAICCGSSVGIGNQRNAGTLGALASKKGSPKTIYGLSCNHVIGGCSTARPLTPIVVPGIQDVSADH
ncbi:MAG: hypothetical protein AAGA91_01925, partial [Pseudomonadota bacterium]